MIATTDFALDRAELAPQLDRVDGVVFDIDGCLMLSDGPSGHQGTALPGAARAVATARDTGRRIACFTNGSMQPPAAIAQTLRGHGIDVEDHEVMTPSVVAAEIIRLRHPGGRVLAFGGEGVLRPLGDAGVEIVEVDEAIAGRAGKVDAVLVGWDVDFGRTKIQAAAEAVLSGARIYTTSDVPSFASKQRLNVGVSSFIAAGLSHVTRTPYELVGKPSYAALEAISSRLRVAADRLLVVGDDLELEATLANRAGGIGILVTTGTHSRGQAEQAPEESRPLAIIDSLDELSEELIAHPGHAREEDA